MKTDNTIHKCPNCGKQENSVIDSRPTKLYIRRRRRCDLCLARWTTVEITESDYKFLLKRRDYENTVATISKKYFKQLPVKEQAELVNEIYK